MIVHREGQVPPLGHDGFVIGEEPALDMEAGRKLLDEVVKDHKGLGADLPHYDMVKGRAKVSQVVGHFGLFSTYLSNGPFTHEVSSIYVFSCSGNVCMAK